MKKLVLVLCASFLLLACDDPLGSGNVNTGGSSTTDTSKIDADTLSVLKGAGEEIPANAEVYKFTYGSAIPTTVTALWSKSTNVFLVARISKSNDETTDEMIQKIVYASAVNPPSLIYTQDRNGDITSETVTYDGWEIYHAQSYLNKEKQADGSWQTTTIDDDTYILLKTIQNVLYSSSITLLDKNTDYICYHTTAELSNPEATSTMMGLIKQ